MSDKFWGWITSLSSVTDATGTAIACNGVDRLTYEVEYPTLSTAGTVIIEWSSDASYAGVWVQIASLAWAAATTKQGGTVLGPLGFVRARLTSRAGTNTAPFIAKFQGSAVR